MNTLISFFNIIIISIISLFTIIIFNTYSIVNNNKIWLINIYNDYKYLFIFIVLLLFYVLMADTIYSIDEEREKALIEAAKNSGSSVNFTANGTTVSLPNGVIPSNGLATIGLNAAAAAALTAGLGFAKKSPSSIRFAYGVGAASTIYGGNGFNQRISKYSHSQRLSETNNAYTNTSNPSGVHSSNSSPSGSSNFSSNPSVLEQNESNILPGNDILDLFNDILFIYASFFYLIFTLILFILYFKGYNIILVNYLSKMKLFKSLYNYLENSRGKFILLLTKKLMNASKQSNAVFLLLNIFTLFFVSIFFTYAFNMFDLSFENICLAYYQDIKDKLSLEDIENINLNYYITNFLFIKKISYMILLSIITIIYFIMCILHKEFTSVFEKFKLGFFNNLSFKSEYYNYILMTISIIILILITLYQLYLWLIIIENFPNISYKYLWLRNKL